VESSIQKRVLVVEDDALMRELMSLSLRDAGYCVIEAAGQDAARLDQAPEVDVAVVDLISPKAAPNGVVSGLRARFPRAAFVAVSGYFPAQTSASGPLARQLGVERTLPKPFKCEELVTLVAELADGAAQGRPAKSR